MSYNNILQIIKFKKMKEVLLVIASLFTITCASASNVEKIQFANAGDFALGVMVGVPSVDYGADHQTPTFSVDAMWGLKDGFCHTKAFGDNGAIDLGLYVGYFYHSDYYAKSWDLPLAARCGFNWEFVKKLDVYAGLQGGVSILHSKLDYHESALITPHVTGSSTGSNGILGIYSGVKWMFTDVFGVKAEYSGDWLDLWSLPTFAAGVQFNF